MAKYTWDDIIINPTTKKVEQLIGKQVYFSGTPTRCLYYANHDMEDWCGYLETIDLEEEDPFVVCKYHWSCIIVKKEPQKAKYAPFKSAEEFIKAHKEHTEGKSLLETDSYLREHGFWITYKNKDGRMNINYISDDGLNCGDSHVDFDSLLKDYLFLDGTQCGKEVVNNE